MIVYNTIDLMKEHARAVSKFCMYISWLGQNDTTEIIKAAPYMRGKEDTLYLLSKAVLVFDTEVEAYSHYNMTVGDSGPTKDNDYDGLARVYAVICSDAGNLVKENTINDGD